MAVALGKRKRRADPSNDEVDGEGDSGSESEGGARESFKRAFEARFKPLPRNARAVKIEELSQSKDRDEEEESDFSGFSEKDNDVETIEVVENQGAGDGLEQFHKKGFMTARIPSSSQKPATSVKKTASSDEEDDKAEASNLKNDLALQRLLKEAHLLDSSSVQTSATAREGNGRLKALDMRLRDLGAKDSHLKQDRMPLAHRRGMRAKSASRETQRRKEAAENGVVIEKAMATTKAREKRERGVGGPTVGKFRGGMLKLSSRDVRQIQGSRGAGTLKGRKR